MQVITVRNKEVHKIYILLGVFLILVTFLFLNLAGPWILLLIPIACVLATNTSGVQFDVNSRQYRKYKHFMFRTVGEWKNLSPNLELVILSKIGSKVTSGTRLTGTLETKGNFYELYLMDSNHLKRFFISSSTNKKEITAITQNIHNKLDIPISSYNPNR